MAQSVKSPTLDFSSGHNLMVHEIEPMSGSALTSWSLLGILSLPLSVSAPPPLVRPLSEINKRLKKKGSAWVAQSVL